MNIVLIGTFFGLAISPLSTVTNSKELEFSQNEYNRVRNIVNSTNLDDKDLEYYQKETRDIYLNILMFMRGMQMKQK